MFKVGDRVAYTDIKSIEGVVKEVYPDGKILIYYNIGNYEHTTVTTTKDWTILHKAKQSGWWL